MATNTDTRTARRLYELWNEGRVGEIAELVAADFTGHGGLGAGGREGLVQDLETLKAAFPDATLEIGDVIANDDRVVVHGTLRGTHQGPFAGVPPSGSQVEVLSTDIWRVDDAGKLAECWALCDSGALLMQIGAISQPAPEPTTTEEQAEAFVGRLFEASVGGWELLTTHVGLRLGLYAALAEAPGGITSAALADATAMHPRYAQEWLEQQVTAGIVDVDDVTAAPEDRTFSLPAAHAEVLLNEESPFHAAPLADWTASLPSVLDRLIEAYQSGGGVAWGEFGETVLDGQAAFNRPLFQHTLAANLGAHFADVDARLREDGGRVADVACGYGWSSIALANAYPKVAVEGVDVDGPSVERARQNVTGAGLDGRVTITARDAADTEIGGPYELVTVFEAVHDMSRPVEVLANIRSSLVPGGSVLVMDENVADEFGQGIGNPVERFMYAASILCCLPAGMAESPSAATGTVMRPATMQRYAEKAGFTKTTVLPVEDPFHKYYRLDA